MRGSVLLALVGLVAFASAITVEDCEGCIMWQGYGYKPHPTDCTKYYFCVFYPDGTFNSELSTVKTCPTDFFWAPRDLVCRPPNHVDCPNDPCKTNSINQGLYVDSVSCRKYWICRRGKTRRAGCCPEGYRYIDANGLRPNCNPDVDCTYPCGPVIQTTTIYPCHFTKHPSSTRKYIWTWNGGSAVMECAPGTIFVPAKCGCLHDVDASPPPDVCEADTYIPMQTDWEDKSGNNHHVQTESVVTPGWMDGHSKISVNRYANADFGNKIVVQMHIREQPGRGPMTMFTSGCDNTDAPIHISIDNGVIRGRVVVNGKAKHLKITTRPGLSKNVTLAYDGQKIIIQAECKGSCKKVVQPISGVHGNIQRHYCAFVFGAETNHEQFPYKNYRGIMNNVYVYACVPKHVQDIIDKS